MVIRNIPELLGISSFTNIADAGRRPRKRRLMRPGTRRHGMRPLVEQGTGQTPPTIGERDAAAVIRGGDRRLGMAQENRSTLERVWEVVTHEFHEVLPPTIFFLITFHIVLIDRALMLREYGLRLSSAAAAAVMALLVAKVVLIADKLPFINRFPAKPLIYNVVWKTIIYVLASVFVHYLEHLIPLWWRSGNFGEANADLWREIVWPHFWAIQLWLTVLIFLYCIARELIRVIGRDRILQIFFKGPVPGLAGGSDL